MSVRGNAVKCRLVSVRLLLIDVDGVLTDGQVYVTHSGERFKSFNCRDTRAIAEFVTCGFEVHIITASGWPGLKYYLEKSPAIYWLDNQKTPEALREITQGNPYYAVGDDTWDCAMLEGAERSFCPADADLAIRGSCTQNIPGSPGIEVLKTNGGRGVVAELARILL